MSDEPTREALAVLLPYFTGTVDDARALACEIDALVARWRQDYEDTRDCLNNERKEFAAALARARLAAIEECAKEMDANVQAMRNIADTIQRDWILVDGMSSEDRRANALDRREHLNRIPIYESCARQLRALAAPDTPSEGEGR